MSKETKSVLSRRELLKTAASGVAIFGGMAVVTACGGGGKKAEPEKMKEEAPKEEPKKEAAKAEESKKDMAANEAKSNDPCSDLSGVVDEAEIKKRNKIYKYVEKSKKDGQMCSNCQLYNAPKAEGECGGCQLFKGPVQDAGWCVSWVKKA